MTAFGQPRGLMRGDLVARFDCGVVSLDNWLKNQATRNQESGASRTFVTMAEDGAIAGFYSLSSFSIARADSGPTGQNMPDPVPVTLIGRLAVDRRFARQGLGQSLLQDAVLRAIRVSLHVGSAGILVHAETEAVIGFYERFGFSPLPGAPRTLLLTINDARATLASGQ